MNIEIPDEIKNIKDAEALFRKQWIVNKFPGLSMKATARYLNVSYRTVIRYMQLEHTHKGHEVKESRFILGSCHFCKETQDIHKHHVNGRNNDDIVLNLCAECHKKFHLLNKLYKE